MIGKLLMLLLIVGTQFTPWQNRPATEDGKMIEGVWTLKTAELSGQKLPDEGLKGTQLILKVGNYTYQNDHGVYRLLPSETMPKAIDITGTDGPNKGKTILAIYELNGDTLRICYDLEGKQRPEKLTTLAGTRQFLAVYQRADQNATTNNSKGAKMGKVTGIGGIFFKGNKVDELRDWYKTRLGITINEYGFSDFEWRDKEHPEVQGKTIWSIFPKETKYFGDGPQSFMVNYRVENLDELLKDLRAAGVKVEDKIQEYDFGRFAWIYDPDGNKIELWEPK